jgi:NADPH-dependent glutamate synthase beta subunit-like oxidoreductase
LIVDFDFVVIAAGAQKRALPIPGRERLTPALDFLAPPRRVTATVGNGW